MTLPDYQYGGARAMVEMHAEAMRAFYATWLQARERGVALPVTEDPAYASLEHLLTHVLRAGAGYMIWMCRVLQLPDPGLRRPPEPASMAAEAEAYLTHVLERWDLPLRGITEEQAYIPEYESNWKTRYCIDAMLEHAVMHPLRHRHQLQAWMSVRA